MVKTDFLVIGGGPAGLRAALEASRRGVKTLVVDEGIEAGGQLLKQTHKFFGHEGFYASVRGFEIARQILNSLGDNVDILTMTTVTGIYEDVITAYDRNADKMIEIKPRFTLIATGASERFIQFENNDLPGVYGAGAVQTLMNQYGVLPGERVLMIGSGNIGLIVSYQLLQAGAEVKAIVEIADKIGGYEVHANKIKRFGVPIMLRHTIKEALGDQRVEGAIIVEVDDEFNEISGSEKELAVDTVCIATGLTPSVGIAAMAGVKLEYIPELGGYVPYRDKNMRTNVPNLFIAGDVSGIEEATTAMIEGSIAGLVVASECKKLDLTEEISAMKKELSEFRSGPFSEKVRSGLRRFSIDYPPHSYKDSVQRQEIPRGKLVPIIECNQAIPCNPCQTSCPTGAITVSGNINSLPEIDYSKCVGCGVCVMKCPGLAIFMIQENAENNTDVVVIPWEFALPEKGEVVMALDKNGEPVCEGEIFKVVKSSNKTHLVYLKVPTGYGRSVRNFARLQREDNRYVCRCEEITEADIEKAIEQGFTDFEELRRYLRLGMGPCGGRTCRLNALSILARKTGKKISELGHGVFRPPAMPIKFESLLKGEESHGE